MKRVLLLLVFICLLIIGISGLYGEIKEYRDGEEEYEELERFVVKVPRKESSDIEDEIVNFESNEVDNLEVNFVSLNELNSDCIAWISIPGTNINYPVVKGIDNSYYVTHTFRKKANKSGAIFLDMRNSSDFSDSNSILYGHNLKNSKMFSDLKKFLNENYFNKKREIVIYTAENEYHYEVFAVYKTMEDDSTYRVKFADGGFDDHLNEISNKAKFFIPQENVNRIITLSTCTNDVEGERVVVVGRLVENV